MDFTNNIRRKPAVFTAGFAASAVGAALTIALAVDVLFGRASQHDANLIALMILPVAFFAGSAYVQFHDEHGWGISWLWSKVLSLLASPAQRVFFLGSFAGLALMIVAPLIYRHGIGDFIENIVFDPYFGSSRHSRYWPTVLFWLGFPLFVVTSVFAYFYGPTIGRLLTWISSGSSSKG